MRDRSRVWSARFLVVAAVAGLAACSAAPRPDVTVTLFDDAIDVPATIEVGDGPVRLQVTADARSHHNLIICPAGPTGRCAERGVSQRLLVKPDARDPAAVPDETRALVLAAGWSAMVETDLAPGSWRFYCGIIGHAERGMDRVVEIIDAA